MPKDAIVFSCIYVHKRTTCDDKMRRGVNIGSDTKLLAAFAPQWNMDYQRSNHKGKICELSGGQYIKCFWQG